ncbi:MAG: transcriptional repressor [Planctomycetes bacterium]|nr:transcriptional repressor [Planctomycetota bacterium]
MTTTRELFATHSLRCTRQRMAVYEALCECEQHPTAEELFRLVKPRTQKLSLATVYNSLETLTGAGLVRRLPTTNGCCRYDADTSEHLHVCFRSGSEILDVPPGLSHRLIEGVPRDGLEAIGRHLGMRIDGICVQLIAAPEPADGSPNGRADRI